MTGSYIGLLKLKDKFADVAFVLQTSDGHPDLDGLITIPIWFWGVYFAVEESNPLNEVEVDVLSDVFRKTRDGLKSEWGSLLPNSPRWINRLVFVTFDMAESDPSFPVLLNQFFDDEAPQNYSSMGERIETPYLAGASNLLVMSKMPQPGKGLRALSLVQSGQSVGLPPSAENMFFGDYPLRTLLFIAVRDPKEPKVRAFIGDLFETKRLKMLENSGLVSVP
jgi:ABC-type phosphate transport system substrate-binding protein